MEPLMPFLEQETLELLLELEKGNTLLGERALPAYAALETEFSRLVKSRLESRPEKIAFEPIAGLTEEQNTQVAHAINTPLGVITGGPGTGKSHTAARLVETLQAKMVSRLDMVFSAPTGKAAERLKSLFKGREVASMTLHRLLGQEETILPYDLIVVDEASMIDLKLMIRLLKSVRRGARLLLLGDVNQLPAIDAGAPFQAIVEHLNIHPLKTCLRSDLIELKTFYDLILEGDGEKALGFLKSGARQNLRLKPLQIPTAYPVLTPIKHGPYGVHQINRTHSKKGAIPIIILENDPELELFNGDMGLIQGNLVKIGERSFPLNLLPRHDHAYALSIHKSQGSEFDHVHLLIPEGAEEFGRNLLYTGATRAKKSLTLYADEETLIKTISEKPKRVYKKLC